MSQPTRRHTSRHMTWRAFSLVPLLALAAGCHGTFAPDPANDAVPISEAVAAPTGGASGAPWTGTFAGLGGHRAMGRVRLTIDTAGVAILELQSDFALDPQPDPHLYLNTAASVHAGQPIRIGALQARQGLQRYVVQLPRGTTYTHVVIWCNRYDVGLAQAPVSRLP